MNYDRNQSNPLLLLASIALGALLIPVFKKKMSESERWTGTRDKLKDKYDQIVDEAADKYAKAKGISRNELVDLVDDLKMHWGRIRNAWNE